MVPRLLARCALVLAAAAGVHAAGGRPAARFLEPVVSIDGGDLERLARGDVLARTLSGGTDLVVFAATEVRVNAASFAAQVQDIAALKRSAAVLAIGRFSDPPVIADLASLSLDAKDLEDLRDCRPGSCGLKVSGDEMRRIQAQFSDDDRSQRAVQDAFRRVLLDRVRAYLAGGLAAVPPYEDRTRAVSLDQAFGTVLAGSRLPAARLPSLVEDLRRAPPALGTDGNQFLYWSKEKIGSRPTISVVHVIIARPGRADAPSVVVAGKQIYATHYTNGALSLTMLWPAAEGAPGTLAYLNRSRVDFLGGFLGPLKRAIADRRLRHEGAAVLRGLRARLERGSQR